MSDEKDQLTKRKAFLVRLNNATREIKDEKERERYIAPRWGG